MIYSLILFLLTVSHCSLLRELDTKIIINDITIDTCPNNSPVTVKLMLPSIPSSLPLEGYDGYIISSSGITTELTECSWTPDHYYIECKNVPLNSNTQYSFKNLTIEGYQFISNIPSTSIIQLSVTYPHISDIPTTIVKGQPFDLTLDSSISPVLFLEVNNAYMNIPCSEPFQDESKLKISCVVSSSIDTTTTTFYNIYSRGSCGGIISDPLKRINIETVSFSGSQYINIDFVQDYSYIIQLSSSNSDKSKIVLKSLDNSDNSILTCLDLQDALFNCTIPKDKIVESNKNSYSLYYDELLLIKNAIIIFKTDGVPDNTQIISGELSKTENNSITLVINDIDSTFYFENIKKIQMISNSLATQDNGCEPVTNDLYNETAKTLSIHCSFKANENCTISYYYLNRTNNLNKIGQDLIVGNGIPYYDSSRYIRNINLLLYFSFLLIL